MENSVLQADAVSAIFLDCLFKEGEDTNGYVKAEGITCTVGFHPQRLEGHSAKISEMLSELPDTFKRTQGGGWSFLNACQDRHGRQWTGTHKIMEQLFQLGIGVGKVTCLLPREMWVVLPGGMPYYAIED